MNKRIWDLNALIYKLAMKADPKIYEFMYDQIREMVRDMDVLELAARGDLSNVVAESSQPQDFAIIYHDHRPLWINSHTVVCHIHYMREMINWEEARDR